MNLTPPFQQDSLLFLHEPHGASNFGPGHADDQDQFRGAVSAEEVDLRLTVTEYMHMGRLMVIDKDDNAQPPSTMNGDD
jgi:hypothetical protein